MVDQLTWIIIQRHNESLVEPLFTWVIINWHMFFQYLLNSAECNAMMLFAQFRSRSATTWECLGRLAQRFCSCKKCPFTPESRVRVVVGHAVSLRIGSPQLSELAWFFSHVVEFAAGVIFISQSWNERVETQARKTLSSVQRRLAFCGSMGSRFLVQTFYSHARCIITQR